MKHLKSTYLLLLLLILVIGTGVGCKKYPDGPEFSLMPKKWRLDGDWKLNQALENGTDVTAATLVNTIEYSRKIELNGNFSFNWATNNGTSLSYDGTWTWSDDKTVIYFSYALGAGIQVDTYLILKLERHELWLQNLSPTGDVMQYHFVPN